MENKREVGKMRRRLSDFRDEKARELTKAIEAIEANEANEANEATEVCGLQLKVKRYALSVAWALDPPVS